LTPAPSFTRFRFHGAVVLGRTDGDRLVVPFLHLVPVPLRDDDEQRFLELAAEAERRQQAVPAVEPPPAANGMPAARVIKRPARPKRGR
jgi:hypothetical protein